MAGPTVHIVSFAVPDPPDYGGAIDVYYKIKALSEAGVSVVLHAWTYDNRGPGAELSGFCREIHLYPRQTHWSRAMGTTPYIIASRSDRALERRLLADANPILLEGMHNARLLDRASLRGRRMLLRMHNLEWDYYRELARQTGHPLKKLYYMAEGRRLAITRPVLHHADMLLAISEADRSGLERWFDRVEYLPAFHPYSSLSIPPGLGRFALYHGNLEVAENRRAAEWLMEEVFVNTGFPLVVAGRKPPKGWVEAWRRPGIDIVPDPFEAELSALFSEAQVHVLPTFQATGIKLKLLRALFSGRHVLITPDMAAGSASLAGLCRVAGNAADMRRQIGECWETAVTERETAARREVLQGEFCNAANARRLIQWLYPRH